MEGLFDDLLTRLDALGLGANRERDDDRRCARDKVACKWLIDKLGPVYGDRCEARYKVYLDKLEEDKEQWRNHELGRHDCDRDHYEYKIKVDIPIFSSNFSIEEILDWLVDVDRFFEYMDMLEERRMKLVAHRLKGGA